MASNSGSVYVISRFRPRNREEVVVMGKVKLGTPSWNWLGTPSDQYIYPNDMGLKRISHIQFGIPSLGIVRAGANAANSRRMYFMTGSIGSADTNDAHSANGTPSGCYVQVKTWQLLGSRRDANTGTFSAYLGTIGQTLTAYFTAIGH